MIEKEGVDMLELGEKKDYALYLGDWSMVEKVAKSCNYTLTSYDEYMEVYFGKGSKYRAFCALYYLDEEMLKSQMVIQFEEFFTKKIEEKSNEEKEWYLAPALMAEFEDKVYRPYIVKEKGQIVDVILEEVKEV